MVVSLKNLFMVVKDFSLFGGINRVVANLSHLFAKEYKVTIVSITMQTKTPSFDIPKEVSIINFSEVYPNFSTKNFLDKLKFSWHFNQLLPKNSQNFVIVHQLLIPFFKAKNTTYIRHYHGNFEDGFKKYLYKKPLLPRIKLFDFLVILHDRQIGLWGKLHSNIKVIPNFINTIPLPTTGIYQKVVISIGRFEQEKGFLRLIDIWKIVQENPNMQDWKLHLVGEGSEKEQMIIKINSLKLQDSITLKPFTQQVSQEYKQAAIYAMGSYREAFPMTLLEASSYGIPCIAFEVNGTCAILENERTGILIPNDDLEAFAIKLQSLMTSLDLRKSLGNKAREQVIQYFTSNNIYHKWKEIL